VQGLMIAERTVTYRPAEELAALQDEGKNRGRKQDREGGRYSVQVTSCVACMHNAICFSHEGS